MEGPQPEPVFEAVVAALAEIVASIEAGEYPKKGPVTWYAFDQVRLVVPAVEQGRRAAAPGALGGGVHRRGVP